MKKWSSGGYTDLRFKLAKYQHLELILRENKLTYTKLILNETDSGMKIEIELSKNVDYPGQKLGDYIWNLEESDNHVTGFCDSIGECFVEIIRHR